MDQMEEETISAAQFFKICRICLNTSQIINLRTYQETDEYNEMSPLEMFKEYTNIEIVEDDLQSICMDCFLCLKLIQSFRGMCKKAEESLMIIKKHDFTINMQVYSTAKEAINLQLSTAQKAIKSKYFDVKTLHENIVKAVEVLDEESQNKSDVPNVELNKEANTKNCDVVKAIVSNDNVLELNKGPENIEVIPSNENKIIKQPSKNLCKIKKKSIPSIRTYLNKGKKFGMPVLSNTSRKSLNSAILAESKVDKILDASSINVNQLQDNLNKKLTVPESIVSNSDEKENTHCTLKQSEASNLDLNKKITSEVNTNRSDINTDCIIIHPEVETIDLDSDSDTNVDDLAINSAEEMNNKLEIYKNYETNKTYTNKVQYKPALNKSEFNVNAFINFITNKEEEESKEFRIKRNKANQELEEYLEKRKQKNIDGILNQLSVPPLFPFKNRYSGQKNKAAIENANKIQTNEPTVQTNEPDGKLSQLSVPPPLFPIKNQYLTKASVGQKQYFMEKNKAVIENANKIQTNEPTIQNKTQTNEPTIKNKIRTNEPTIKNKICLSASVVNKIQPNKFINKNKIDIKPISNATKIQVPFIIKPPSKPNAKGKVEPVSLYFIDKKSNTSLLSQLLQNKKNRLLELNNTNTQIHKSLYHNEAPPRPRPIFYRRSYKCRHCVQCFKTQDDRTEHIAEVHKRMIICDSCGKEVQEKSMKRHKRRHEQSFLCDTCGITLKSLLSYNKHIREMHPHLSSTSKVCKECNLKVTDLRKHIYLKHPHLTTWIRCQHCHKKFLTPRMLKNHYKFAHAEAKPYNCEFCQKGYLLKSHLIAHMEVHGKFNRQYKCKKCGGTFIKLSDLRDHLRSVHDQIGKYPCSLCKKVFKTASGFGRHMDFHNKTFKCPKCDMNFSSAFRLHIHFESHTGNFTYQCEICNKGFSLKGSLKSHVNSHFESLQCHICHKSYAKRDYLKKHMVIHEEKRHICICCDRAFAVKANLDAHMRVHTGAKPYTCIRCGESFSYHLRKKLCNSCKKFNFNITE